MPPAKDAIIVVIIMFLLVALTSPGGCRASVLLVRKVTPAAPVAPELSDTYYVDPVNGNDSNDGSSEEQAWASMAKVAISSDPNDTINLVAVTDDLCGSPWPAGRLYYSSALTQYGITWTFADSERVGKYINGDFWALGPVSITGIDPCSYTTDTPTQAGGTFSDRVINGSMLNPIPPPATAASAWQGFDSATVWYGRSLNVAYEVNDANALTIAVDVTTIRSLVSTISRNVVYTSVGLPRLTDAAILTVVAAVPDPNAFRPHYCGATKAYTDLTVDDVNWTPLKELAPAAGRISIAQCEAWLKRPHLEFAERYPNSTIKPENNEYYYARNEAKRVAYACLNLNCSETQAEKQTLLIYVIQMGIDYFGIIEAGGTNLWYSGGGVATGHKLPMIYASVLLDNSTMQAVFAKTGDYVNDGEYGPPEGNWPPDYVELGGEDGQTYTVSQADVDWTNGELWDPEDRDAETYPYAAGDIGLPEWGINYIEQPWTSNNWWPTYYRQIPGGTFPGTQLAVLMIGAKTLWNHDVFFDYTDRYVAMLADEGDYASWQTGINGVDESATYPWSWNMWESYRTDYGPVWSE